MQISRPYYMIPYNMGYEFSRNNIPNMYPFQMQMYGTTPGQLYQSPVNYGQIGYVPPVQPPQFANNSIYSILDNPLAPIYDQNNWGNSAMPNWNGTMFPPMVPPPRPSGIQMVLNSFKNQDGQIDFNKMFSAAGQLVGTVNQVTGLIKGLSQIFKV